MVYRSIRTHLVDAFGGDATTFAALKLDDARGDTRPEFGGLVATSEAAVRHALSHIGVSAENRLVTNASALPGARFPTCGRPRYAESGRPRDLFDSLVGQLNNRQACHTLISNAERRASFQFTYVIFARPDLSWPAPMRPYCFWDLTRTYHKWDWALLLTRSLARHVLHAVPEELWTCARVPYAADWSDDGIQAPESYMAVDSSEEQRALITAMLTRQDQPDMPSNICEVMRQIPGPNGGADAICARVTYQNACANL